MQSNLFCISKYQTKEDVFLKKNCQDVCIHFEMRKMAHFDTQTIHNAQNLNHV